MRHPITGDEILFAPERAGRPNAFGREEDDVCLFCPGNEMLTPPAIETVGDPWRVRIFPNKYPVVPGHEVIVESRAHDGELDAEGIAAWSRRFAAHASSAKYVSIFRNSGERAGASIDHPHSQLVPLGFVPPRIERELAGFRRGCPLCSPHRNVIRENESWIAFAPDGSTFAYQQWIVPRRHVATIAATNVESLAPLLTAAVAAMKTIARSYNLLLMNFPSPEGHFYIELFPRMTPVAGFELATGTFIDVIDPAAAARILR